MLFGRNLRMLQLASAFTIILVTSMILRSYPFQVTFDEGVEIIRSKGYPIIDNLQWNEITAAGIKVTEKSWKGFLQICERLVGEFGNFQIYIDAEVRVMWVYADPTADESEREAYYVHFP